MLRANSDRSTVFGMDEMIVNKPHLLQMECPSTRPYCIKRTGVRGVVSGCTEASCTLILYQGSGIEGV